jgi:hypothetical protein
MIIGRLEAPFQETIAMAATASSEICGFLQGPPMSVADIYANARALSGYLREKAAEIEEARHLPADVVARVRAAGLFRLTMPKIWVGTVSRVLELQKFCTPQWESLRRKLSHRLSREPESLPF